MNRLLVFVLAVTMIQITIEAVGDCNDSINPGKNEAKCSVVDIGSEAKCCLIKYTAGSDTVIYNCKRLPKDSLDDDKAAAFVKTEYGLIYVDHDCSSCFFSLTALALLASIAFLI